MILASWLKVVQIFTPSNSQLKLNPINQLQRKEFTTLIGLELSPLPWLYSFIVSSIPLMQVA